MFAAAVIAFAGIAFGVFVGKLAALRFHYGGADVVFRGNQLDMVLLALVFGGDGGGEFGVEFFDGQTFGKHIFLLFGRMVGSAAPQRLRGHCNRVCRHQAAARIFAGAGSLKSAFRLPEKRAPAAESATMPPFARRACFPL